MSIIPTQHGVTYGKGTLYNSPIKLIPPPEGIEFGRFCAIGPNLKIIGTNHDYNFPAVQYTFYKNYFQQEHPIDRDSPVFSRGKITIGHDVWIGDDVTILSGVTVGHGVCIGAGSIVTRDLEPYTVCAGVRCRKIKNRYKEDVVKLLLDIQWWNWSDDTIKANKQFFNMNLNNHTAEEIKAAIV
jgi:hypothetical protein